MRFVLTWKIETATISTGIGLRNGDILSVSWMTQGQTGIAVYRIGKDRKLIGLYTAVGSIGLLVEETLTP